ncbi:MAG TPA: alcohol dehydrogenase catalytic domain-containing protein [Actinomycetota bacterium]
MRAAVLTAPRAIEVRDVPEPTHDDALVRTRWVGVCGTDLSIYAGKIPVAYPRVLGHELCAEVIDPGDVGRERGIAPGMRVVVDPNVFCGRCDRCLEGRANLCANGTLLGRDADGALSSLLAAPARNLYRVPDALPDEAVPLIQVLTTCTHAQRRIAIFPGDTVVVLGLGVTGLLHVQLAALRGASVIGVTRSADKRALAARLGAGLTVDATAPDAVDLVKDATGGVGPDVVIECAGYVETLARAVELARSGGRILAYGTIAQREGDFPYYQLYYKELDIVNARAAQAEDYPVAIGAIEAGRVDLSALVTHRFDLDDVATAIETAGDPSSLKVVVRTGD